MGSNKLVSAVIVMLMAPLAQAQGTVWKCIGPDGRPQYTNVQHDTQGRQCTVVSREVSVVPGAAPKAGSEAAPTGFPKVDPATQRARDDTRRQILEKELDSEQKQLDEARTKLAEEEAVRYGNERNYQRVLDRLKPFKEAVAQHEQNVQDLKKEIDNLK